MERDYLYGPVSSRRLGRSLGVDILPHKTCNFDCVYCECGKSNVLINERREYYPADEIINKLDIFLKKGLSLDYITFSGSGEPTLNSGIGRIISFLKEEHPRYKVAVLTNSTLLNDNQVLEDILEADLIVPSLDAVSEEVFNEINRPHEDLKLHDIKSGIHNLSKAHSNIYLEVLFLSGINDSPEELKLFKEYLDSIKFSQLQINTLSRAGTELDIKGLSFDELKEIENYFNFRNSKIAY